MKIGIIVAMDKELKQLQTLFNDEQVRVEKCGIGKVPFISFRVISDIPLRDTKFQITLGDGRVFADA